MIERIPNSSPTPDERERIHRAYEEADPTRFSQLPPDELGQSDTFTEQHFRRLRTDGISEYAPLSEGGKERDITDQQPVKQQVIARILKGVMNVADVVKGPGGGYYSKYLPHDRIEEGAEADDIHADTLILSLVFNDVDHAYRPEKEAEKEHRNLKVEHGAVSYFDFEMAEPGSLPSRLSPRVSAEAIEKSLPKLDALRAHLSGEEGRQLLAAIIAESGTSYPKLFPYAGVDEAPQSFQEFLLRRIDHARFLAKQALQSRREAA